MGVFPGRPQSCRHQRRPVDYCSPGRGGIAQNGRTWGGTFHGEIDRCRESQGWTTACSSMPERDGKDQGEDSPKEAGSCWFARPFALLRFHLYAFVEAAALRSIVLRYADVPIATRTSFFSLVLLFIRRCRFLRVFFFTIYLS